MRRVRDDAGSAFMTVMATTSILFVLATTLLMMVAYQTQSTGVRVGRVRAMHVADAGINAYLFLLKNDYDGYLVTPDTGWVTVADGETYRVIAVPPTGTDPLTLFSTGVAGDGTVTVAATVQFPTFGDYMFLSNASLDIAADALVSGQVRSNGSINNQGHIVGKVSAGGEVSGNGRFDQGYEQGVAVVDFNQVLNEMDGMAQTARASGTYFPASGTYGYRVIVSGSNLSIATITGGITTGELVTGPVTSMSIPTSGVVYFADPVWVEGSYGAPVTIVSDGDIYVTGDYVPSNPNSTVTSGLISHENIIVPGWYRSVKEDMYINAALLAESGRIYADIKQGVIRNRINITGSMAYYDSGGTFGSYDKWTGQPIAGFRQNVYSYDQRLNKFPPPMYPVVRDGSIKVDTWIEDGEAPE